MEYVSAGCSCNVFQYKYMEKRTVCFCCLSTYHDSLSDLTTDDGILDTLEVGIETPLQTSHELNTGLITGVDGLDGLGEVGGKGLLAKHMLAIGGAGLDLLGVVLGGGADPDGIDLGVGDNIHGISSEARDTEISGGCIEQKCCVQNAAAKNIVSKNKEMRSCKIRNSQTQTNNARNCPGIPASVAYIMLIVSGISPFFG